MNTNNKEYLFRINRSLDYIEQNLTEDLTLEMVAEVANFSKFHFHRIFRSIVGERLFEYIQRKRIEKAAIRLINNTETPVTDIAYDCGFSSPSVFARAFKEAFGMSATEWRIQKKSENDENSNLSKLNRNTSKRMSNFSKEVPFTVDYFCDVNGCSIIEWKCKMLNSQDFKIKVVDCPAFDYAYVRHIGPYKGNPDLFGRLFGQICGWAGPRGLIIPGTTKIMCVYYDDPEITDQSKLRLDVCLSVPKGTEVSAPIGKMTMAAGKYAIAEVEVGMNEYEEAWGFVYGSWLPQSGFQPDDMPCYENYLTDPKDHPEGRCKVEICIPVKPI